MKNLKKLLFAAVLIGAAVVSAPKTASASNAWCLTCDASGGTNCFACCKCAGGTTPWCIQACPS